MTNELVREYGADGWQTGTGEGGDSSPVVLGPYLVEFDTIDVNNQSFFVPGAPIMADGFWITATLVEFTEAWGDGGDPNTFDMQAKLGVAPSDEAGMSEWINKIDPYEGAQNIMVDALIKGSGLPAIKRQFRIDTALWSEEVGQSVTAATLAMEIYSNRDPFTAGQIRVWAVGVQA